MSSGFIKTNLSLEVNNPGKFDCSAAFASTNCTLHDFDLANLLNPANALLNMLASSFADGTSEETAAVSIALTSANVIPGFAYCVTIAISASLLPGSIPETVGLPVGLPSGFSRGVLFGFRLSFVEDPTFAFGFIRANC